MFDKLDKSCLVFKYMLVSDGAKRHRRQAI